MHGSGRPMKMLANPVRLSETPPDYRLAPPMLGEHTDQVLRERLGLGDADLARLRADSVI
jgi:crotonobetainyl-CoA:carnitine CoA-transferase CaiB-like acyl-CoA transferase